MERVSPSPRERQLLALIYQGLSYKEIAARLTLAETTVTSYSFRLASDLRVQGGREGLVRWTGQHEEVFDAGTWVEVATHPDDCQCDSASCVTMRRARRVA